MKISNIWRLLRIILIFSRRQKVKAKDIAKDIEISVRQVYRDIECLKLAGIPIYSDRNGFALTPDFFMPHISLEIPEILTLFLLSSSIKAQKGTPYSDLISSAYDKILNSLPESLKKVLSYSDFDVTVDFGLDTKVDYSDKDEIFNNMYEASITRKKVIIIYYSMDAKKVSERIVDPYAFKLSFGIWYMVGYCHLRNEIRTFRIDRIKEAEVLNEDFSVPENFDIEKFFAGSWGIIKGKKSRVLLKFSKSISDFIQECRWHPSQKIIKNSDGSISAEFEIEGLSEIKIWILGFGSDVEVIWPKELRDDIKRTAEGISGIYSG